VTKDQALARVGTSELRSAVSLARATLTAAEESLASAQSGSSSLQIASAKAQVAQAKSNLAAARDDLAAGTLRSTIAGTVAAVNVSTGDTVGSSNGSGGSDTGNDSGSTADVVVISTSSWIVNASVGSADLASIKKGLQAQITPTDSTTRVFGTVQSVGIVASSDSTSSSATFPVVIAVTGNPAGMYAGASANVTVIVKQISGVLTVPTAALHSQAGKTYVLQVKNGKQVKTFVTVGTTYGPSTQIRSGLSSGATVVVPTSNPRIGTTGTNGKGQGRQFDGGFGGGGFGGGGPVIDPNGGGGNGGAEKGSAGNGSGG
jgi:multidrug efflux pump subunit AcrA (membrane-fusion protein)